MSSEPSAHCASEYNPVGTKESLGRKDQSCAIMVNPTYVAVIGIIIMIITIIIYYCDFNFPIMIRVCNATHSLQKHVKSRWDGPVKLSTI